MAKKLSKTVRKRSKVPAILRFMTCVFCPKRVVKPQQLCAKCERRTLSFKGPRATKADADIYDIMCEGRSR